MTTEAPKIPTAPETADAEKSVACQHGDTSVGEKCYECDVVVPFPMFGGSQSFAEVDQWREAAQAEQNVGSLTFEFREIMDNIFADDELEMTAKLARINSAIDEMKERIDDPEASKAASEAQSATQDGPHAAGWRRLIPSGRTKVTTKREAGADFKASDYASVGDTAKSSTWKLRLAQGQSGNFTVAQVGRAITAMQPSGFRGQRVDLTAPKDQVVSKIRRAIGRTGGTDEQKANLRERLSAVKVIAFGRTEAGGSFSLKEIDGHLWWVGVYSNAFNDHDDETLSEAAHKEFIDHCEANQRWPVLELWHTDGTEIGQTKSIAYADRFTVAIGTIDKGREDVARRLEKSGPLAMSHGFAYAPRDRDADGVFSRYRTHEISVLPAGMAANELTGWSLNTEEIQMFEGKQRDFFVDALGEDETKVLEAQLAKASEKAEQDGMVFKDILTAVAEPPVTPDPKPEPTPPTVPESKPIGLATSEPKTDATMPDGIVELIKAVNNGFETIEKTLAQHGDAIEELQQSDAEKLASKIRPIRIGLPEGASQDKETIIDGSKGTLVREANKADQPPGGDPSDPLAKYLNDVGVTTQAAG